MAEVEYPEPGVYRHYKGDLYEVEAQATMSNTDQEGARAVIYRSVNRGTLWVRTLTGPDGWATPLPDGRPRFEPFAPDEPPFPYSAIYQGRMCRVTGLDSDHPHMRSVWYGPLDRQWVQRRFLVPTSERPAEGRRFNPDDSATYPANDQRVEVWTAGEWRDALFRISPAGPYWSVPGVLDTIYAAEAGDRWLPTEGDR